MVKKAEDHLREKNRIGLLKTQKTQWVLKKAKKAMDKVKDKLGTAVAVLAAVSAEGRVQLAAGVSRDLTDRVKAGELVNSVAQKLGGKGGGKPDMAMAGAQSAEGLDAALADVQAWVEAKL